MVVLGTTGEAVSQTRAECIEVLRTVHDHVAGRVPLIAGPFGANHTRALRERLSDYADVLRLPGYAAIMSSVPSYVKPNQEGIYRHFMETAEVATLPILLYNVPGRTGVHMTAETTVRLATQSDGFLGVKEASGDLAEGMRLLRDRPAGFRVYSGDDITALALMSCGADGVISVIANAYPRTFSDMARAALAADLPAARRLNDVLLDLHHWLYVDGNPSGIKAVLAQLGLCGDAVRLPLAEVTAATAEAIREEVVKIQAELSPAWA